ncbi:MAG: metallophosphoesterase family protein [Candidatus Aminicenantaceae bacterium]
MAVKILHTSDLHLGNGFQGLDSTKRKDRRDDLLRVFRKIVQTAKEKKVNAVLIVGDLFDRSNPPTEVVDRAIKILEELEDLPVIIVPGNHDPATKESVYHTKKFPENLTLITRNKFKEYEFPDFILYAAAYDQRNPAIHPLKNLKISRTDKPVIVAVHGSYLHSGIKWNENYETEDYWPIEEKEISKLKNASYIALGHYHNFYLGDSAICFCYPGTPEGLSFNERGERFVAVVNIDDTTTVEKISLNEKRYEILNVDCTKITEEEEIEKLIEEKADENTILQISLKGVLSPDVKLDSSDKLKERFEDQFFHLDVTDKTHLPEINFPSHTVKGIYVRMLEQRRKKAKTEREKRIINQAIRYGIASLDDYL